MSGRAPSSASCSLSDIPRYSWPSSSCQEQRPPTAIAILMSVYLASFLAAYQVRWDEEINLVSNCTNLDRKFSSRWKHQHTSLCNSFRRSSTYLFSKATAMPIPIQKSLDDGQHECCSFSRSRWRTCTGVSTSKTNRTNKNRRDLNGSRFCKSHSGNALIGKYHSRDNYTTFRTVRVSSKSWKDFTGLLLF